ncbi:MAG: hypothetical protein AABX59_03010 [Nanoarchaeota archaeon]
MEKILGLMDLAAVIFLVLFVLNLISSTVLLYVAFILIIKAWTFTLIDFDLKSKVDLVVSVLFALLVYIAIPSIIMVVASLWLIKNFILAYI